MRARRAAADRQRQGRPRARCPAPDGRAAPPSRAVRAAHAGRASCVAGIWARGAGRASGSASTTTSSSSAATRCWPRRWSARLRQRWASSCRCAACSSARRWRSWRPRWSTRAPPARAADGRRLEPPATRDGVAAAVVRAAAAVVPGPAGARQPGLQHAAGRCGCAARSTRRRCERRSTRSWRRHEALRTTFRPVDGEPRAGASTPPAPRAAAAVDLTGAPDPRGEPARLRRRARPPRPSTWPPGRCCGRALLRARRATSTCCCSPCTTSSSDGWSLGVLVRELAALYAPHRGRAPPAAAAAGAVRRLRRLAARAGCAGDVLDGAARPTGGEQLAGRAGRCWSCRRPAAPGGAELPRRHRAGSPLGRGADGRRCAALAPRQRRHAVHGAAGRLPGAAGRYRGRTTSWSARRSPTATGRRLRGADRLLRQHAGAARRPVRRPDLRASCWAACAGDAWTPTRTRTCRSSSWWRSWTPERDRRTHAAVPGDVQPCRTRRPARCELPRPDAGRRWRPVRTGTAKFDLSLVGRRRRRTALRGAVEYSTDLFDRGHGRAAGRRTCATCCERRRGRPGPPVRRAAAAAAPASARGCAAAGTTTARVPAEHCLPRAVRGAGGAHAGRGRGRRRRRALTYRELDARANRLAHRLRALGVRPGDAWWALCLERSPELVVGAAGRAQGRRRLPAAGPGVPGRAAGRSCSTDARRRRCWSPTQPPAGDAARAAATSPAGRWTPPTRAAAPRRPTRRRGRAGATWPTSSTPPAPPAGPRACMVAHAHVARLFDATRAPVPASGRRRVDAVPLVRVRLLGLGAVGRAAARRPRWWWCRTGSAARRRRSTSCWRASGSRCSTRRRPPSAS